MKICAWDFDKTITTEETRGFMVFTSDEERANYLKDIPNKIRNLERLKKLFTRMHHAGIILAVVSFAVTPTVAQVKGLARYQHLKDTPLTNENILGGKELILAYLDAAFGKGRLYLLPQDIIAYRYDDTINKNSHLEKLMKLHDPRDIFLPIIQRNEVMLVDDNKRNISDAQYHGYQTCWVAADNDDYLTFLEKQLDLHEIYLAHKQDNKVMPQALLQI